jgi:hypothetical protein
MLFVKILFFYDFKHTIKFLFNENIIFLFFNISLLTEFKKWKIIILIHFNISKFL